MYPKVLTRFVPWHWPSSLSRARHRDAHSAGIWATADKLGDTPPAGLRVLQFPGSFVPDPTSAPATVPGQAEQSQFAPVAAQISVWHGGCNREPRLVLRTDGLADSGSLRVGRDSSHPANLLGGGELAIGLRKARVFRHESHKYTVQHAASSENSAAITEDAAAWVAKVR